VLKDAPTSLLTAATTKACIVMAANGKCFKKYIYLITERNQECIKH